MNGSQEPVAAAVLVSVEIDWDAIEPGVFFNPKGGVPGSIDTTPETEAGAVYGVRYALETARALPCAVILTEIQGSETRRNPTLVAAATTHAVWEALCFVPDRELVQRVESTAARCQARADCPLLSFD